MSGLDPLSWAILLMLVGCALIVLEVFIPSGGILTFLSIAALVASLVMAFRRDPTIGLAFMVVAVIAVPSVIALAFKYWPHTPMGKAFLGELPSGEEIVATDRRRDLVGRVGIAKSKMLPSGAVMIDDKLVDAVSQGAAIDSGQAVVVMEVRANRVVVRPADPEESRRASVDEGDVLSKSIDELGLESLEDPLA